MTALRAVRPAAQDGEDELARIKGELVRALGEIRYGSIEIVIHDAQVIQIERRERVRFERGDRSDRSERGRGSR